MARAILIKEGRCDINEIDLDIDPSKNEIVKLLLGRPTFIGQWPEIDVVILKAESGHVRRNKHILPEPFTEEETLGPILLVRMDHNSDPQDFTLREYNLFRGW